MAAPTTLAAVGTSGWSGVSALNMYFPLLGTVTRKPGVAPVVLPRSMTHVPSAERVGSRMRDGSHVLVAMPVAAPRFVNQAESGTSSRLLTFAASPLTRTEKVSEMGRKTM